MKYVKTIGLFLCFSCSAIAKGWTPLQLDKANTAKDVEHLTDMEKKSSCILTFADFILKIS